MKTLVECYFDYRTHPTEVMRELVSERRFSAAFVGYFVAALCWVCFFWIGGHLTTWGFIWRLLFFWLLEMTVGYLWAALSGLFLSFFSHEDGAAALFISLGVSGFLQGLLLCFALFAAAFKGLAVLSALVVSITLVLRFSSVVLNTARAGHVGLNKSLAALCFILVLFAAVFFLFVGGIVLIGTAV